jgi:hypothetical protein
MSPNHCPNNHVISIYSWCKQDIYYIRWETLESVWVNANLNSTFLKTQHTQHTHHCIYYTQNYKVRLQNWLQENLHFTLQSVFLYALLLMQTQQLCDDVYYLTIHVILNVWVKLVDSVLYYTINEFPKRDSPALIVRTTTHFLHITVHIFQKIMTHHCKNVITDIHCVTIHPTILDNISMMQTIIFQ